MTPPFGPLNSRGTALGDEVYAVIGEAILDGRLRPGERLRDVALAERLGISRTPVREALQRLERVGLVEVSPNRYTRVSIPSEKARDDMNEFIAHFMGSAARIAVERASDQELAAALEHADAMVAASASDDHAALLTASASCFEVLTQATDNATILTVMREAELAIRRQLADWRPPIADRTARTEAYARFRDAVAARDGATTEARLRALHGFS